MVAGQMGEAGKTKAAAPTVDQIQSDVITELASKYWLPGGNAKKLPFDPKVITEIYGSEIVGTRFNLRRIMMLEFSQYLERYLWPNYGTGGIQSSIAHVLSIIIMVNEKFRERVPAWECFKNASATQFADFFRHVLELALSTNSSEVSYREHTSVLEFLIHIFNSLEVDIIRQQVKLLVSFPVLVNILPSRLEELFKQCPKYRKYWNGMKKADEKADTSCRERTEFERRFLSRLLSKFFLVLESIDEKGPVPADKIHYCERFIELTVDLEALLPTRRFFNVLIDDAHLVVRCRMSGLAKRSDGKLFTQLLSMLEFYAGFEINDQTGEPLADGEMTDIHYNKITALQKAAFKNYNNELRRFALSNVAAIDTREALLKHLSPLKETILRKITASLNLVPEESSADGADPFNKDLMIELLVHRHQRRLSQLEAVNEMPLYPTEEIIWDENVVPVEYFSGEGCLALPKLNLQFLTLHDYLLRNFHLFRLESTYEIRQDIEDTVYRMKPWRAEDGSTTLFAGWARMAQPITGFNVVEVAQPNIGENHPARVRADVTINLSIRPEIKREWEQLRQHDVAFLVTVRPTNTYGTRYNFKEPFIPQVGLTYVRGCEIEGMLDETGRVIEEGPDPRPVLRGDKRTFRVWLDPNQYQQDMTGTVTGKEDVYETFNIIMRRKPKENNFKAVLETMKDLMNTECVVPSWLHDIILGYGDPGAAHYKVMPNQIATLDWNDTFLSIEHLKSAFPGQEIVVKEPNPQKQVPPFRLTFPIPAAQGRSDKATNIADDAAAQPASPMGSIVVEPHVTPNRGPYPYNQPKRNSIYFTPTQIEAIRAGMQPGLTMVVGPPGTGKTDVAVQIIANLYHNFPEQRTLIVTHSNQALNQLFEKIMALDVDERHLLRLGHGEEALETEKDFSRYGRVNYVLAKRLQLLEDVLRLQTSLGVPGDVAYTCETAGHFFLYQVLARWEEFQSKIKPLAASDDVDVIKNLFPFTKYFESAPQPLFKQLSFAEDLEIAEGCFRHIRRVFAQLDEFRAFELLRSGKDRAKYLLIKEAKIIAMTCTHAALKRRDLVQAGFKYDNILMEESAQILEIETFIPLLLQNPEDGFNRLKRWIMIGDHHQLPPVIKNMAFQKYCNMEQSLFTRFVRLGVPTVDLDAQGRARGSICNLYNWRYKKLGNLPHVSLLPEYQAANAGFAFDFQLVNVEDFNGVGESEPNPHFYQNLAEAEYIVAVYMYMRLLGYPADKISILTTYNGQKHLIRDVIQQRCAQNSVFGRPSKITTVDRFQGQQNDYILLSLVRTRTVGHLRDVRRLIVAMSRARLGLYVFARVSLFQNCFELTPAFSQLTSRPLSLWLFPGEAFPTSRKVKDKRADVNPLIVKDMAMMAQFVYDTYNHRLQHMMKYSAARYELPAPAAEDPALSRNADVSGTDVDMVSADGVEPDASVLKTAGEEAAAAAVTTIDEGSAPSSGAGAAPETQTCTPSADIESSPATVVADAGSEPVADTIASGSAIPTEGAVDGAQPDRDSEQMQVDQTTTVEQEEPMQKKPRL